MSKRATKTWKRWTDDEEQFVRKYTDKLSDAQMAKLLDRTEYSVHGKRMVMSVLRSRSQRRANEGDVYKFIVSYKRANDGNSPTFREIKDGCDLSSTSVVGSCLNRLVAQGKIELGGFERYRSIRVIGARWIAPGEEWAVYDRDKL